MLNEHKDKLEKIASLLIEKETVTGAPDKSNSKGLEVERCSKIIKWRVRKLLLINLTSKLKFSNIISDYNY